MTDRARQEKQERQERAERTRNALIRAAAEVYDRIGYERATLALISSAAGVTKGALYFHFATKAELAEAVRCAAGTATRAAVEELARRHTAAVPPVPALQTVIDVTHLLARALRTDPAVRAAVRLTREAGLPDSPGHDCYRVWGEAVRTLLERARLDGSLRPEPDIPSVAALALYIVAGTELFSRDGAPAGPGPGPGAGSRPGSGPDRGPEAECAPERWIAPLWSLALPQITPSEHLALLRAEGSERPRPLRLAG
ncbi:ScbR family autoregulator-binding transcription factor [Streptomyces sp. URMC 123]|uniref:ScbR family autoregulator-binding transcription factor n=1 Tax=Streptomyces sp. URMC 123 TaxID=3423403 RepID=UPI003F1B8E77